MKIIEIDGISTGYKKVIDNVFEHGKKVSPRGMNTLEISPCTIIVNNPHDRIFYDTIRNMNMAFSIAEWLWIVSGQDDLKMLTFYNSKMLKYSDNGRTLHGAYGKRLRNRNIDQFEYVLNKLKDIDTRQAVMTILDPQIDFINTKDVPCTIDFQFFIRNNKLNMISHMRSNDIYFGFPNDLFNFTMIQEMFATELGIEIGTYTHIVNSLHLYETEFEKVQQINDVETTIQNKMNFESSKMISWIDELKEIEQYNRFLCYYNDNPDFKHHDNKFIEDIVELLICYSKLKYKKQISKSFIGIMISKHNPYTNFVLRSLNKQ